MSIDFANEAFITSASSSCVCADGYLVTNLSSKDQLERLRGFQGERFVRPPITIQFQFCVPVDIHRIEFLPYIGKQCAKVIHLHVSRDYPRAKMEDPSRQLQRTAGNDEFTKAGNIVLTKPTRVSFVNRVYRPHQGCSAAAWDDSTVSFFADRNLNSVSALRIIIASMLEGSVPSLSGLHIWGKPDRSCPRSLSRKIFHVSKNLNMELEAMKSCTPPIQMYGPHPASGESYKLRDSLDQSQESSPDVDSNGIISDYPKEFIDPLTLEVMRMPVLLPSGHTIDRSTLDNHIKSQSEMGHIASDPFTGIPLTGSNKPEPNVKLKVRMDSFALESWKVNYSNNISATRKRCLRTNEFGEMKKTLGKLDVFEAQSTSSTDFHSGPHQKLENAEERFNTRKHSDELSSSLSSALVNVRPKKTMRNFAMNESSSALHCAKCKNLMPLEAVRYRLPCCHVVCFECARIVNGGKLTCPDCLISYESSTIQRIFN